MMVNRKLWEGIINEYKEFMPVRENTKIITLQEGNTPLIFAEKLSNKLDIELYLKYEGVNPTGSFKDRGMTLAVTKAVENVDKAIICASTGNTSASAAAYGSKAGLKTVVIIPEGKIALGKLTQALMHGSIVIPIKGNFDNALDITRKIAANYPITLVNSLNPYRIEGQKSAAFEVCDQLGGVSPDILAIPVGNAGNITAYWKGFKEYYQAQRTNKLPKMLGFEAEGSAAIVKKQVINSPETIATAIRIGNPVNWEKAVDAATESKGSIDFVTDEEILDAYKELALEGVFAEPASAASVAGIKKYVKLNKIGKGSKVVAVLTGHGLKDPDTALSTIQTPEAVEPNLDKILNLIGL